MAAQKPPTNELLLNKLLSIERTSERRAIESLAPPPPSRRMRYRCRICRDTKRVKVPNDIGCTQPCVACSTG